VQRARSLARHADLDAVRAAFVGRKTDAYRTLADAILDGNGREGARRYLDSFYRAIESEEAFYRPVVIAAGTMALSSSDGRRMCADVGAIPLGTPVSEPLDRAGSRVQVRLLDAFWHWAPPVKCAGIRGPVWIEANAIGQDFPEP
jgi:hypothetical protein